MVARIQRRLGWATRFGRDRLYRDDTGILERYGFHTVDAVSLGMAFRDRTVLQCNCVALEATERSARIQHAC